MSQKKVGILGIRGGQLGRMLAASASLLNIQVTILDVGADGPAKQIISHAEHIDGSFSDPAKIRELAAKVDVLTVEIEHVDVDALDAIASAESVVIHPSPSTIRTIQDKFRQKEHLRTHGAPVSEFMAVNPTAESISNAIKTLGLPLMLKSRTLAYDGRGNFVLHSALQFQEAISALSDRPLYAEKWVPFTKEIAVMVVRSETGETKSYPAVETVHKDNVCHLVFAPLRSLDIDLCARAQSVAEDAIKSFSGAGVFGVEMFLMDDGEIYINEIAPRPHNSGHYTIEACHTSQYANHLRAILSLPLGSTAMQVPSAAMLNILGTSSSSADIDATTQVALSIPGASVHLYGKKECRKGRKMGHITLVGNTDAEIRENLKKLLISSDIALYTPSLTAGHSHPFPVASIIMGSDSDLPTMLAAAKILTSFKVPFELSIVSAHRTPQRLMEFARNAMARGIKVIIAGAGGAAHLPGMVASMTGLPVIGVPVNSGSGSAGGAAGIDALYSIVQMPRGIPVATVAINNSTNAGLLAVRILSTAIPRLATEVNAYTKKMEEEVMTKIVKMDSIGWEAYV